MKSIKLFLLLGVACIAFTVVQSGMAQKPQATDVIIEDRPLSYWIDQVEPSLSGEALAETVGALSLAMHHDDIGVRVAAADALAVLGPKAVGAIDALIAQLTHEHAWVRVAAMGALGSMGEEAVPKLVETFRDDSTAAWIRSAFVLGGIGPEAKEAVPVLAAALPDLSDANRDRIRDILSQIAPDAYPPVPNAQRATFRPDEAEQGNRIDAATIATDWPEFHGPRRDSICRETSLLEEWPTEGPPMLWKMEELGRGYSSVSIAGDILYTMGDIVLNAKEGEKQCVLAYDLNSRKRRWATPIGPPNIDGGPRCTPTIDGNRVFVLGTDGDLVCLSVVDGSILWKRNLTQDFDGKVMSIWKFSESPLVDGEKLICSPGSPNAAMVALDKRNGQTIWTCSFAPEKSAGSEGTGYCSPIVAEIQGVRQYIQLLGQGVIGVDANTGRLLWHYDGVANTVANISTPVVTGNYVFATTAYNTGSALLKIERNGSEFVAKEVYFIEPREFQNHHGGVLLVDGYIYGGHGPNQGHPTCVELATGEVVWKERNVARGSAGVLYADGNLIFRYDRGTVVLVEATPEGFLEKGRFVTGEAEGPAWAHPVVHKGRLYLRHDDQLCCYDLRAIHPD